MFLFISLRKGNRRSETGVFFISEALVNGQIRFREVRLIGSDGEQLGLMSSLDALKMAEEAELDLVCVAPAAKPPVCKIIDYGKYRYEMIRRDKEARKKQKIVELKEVRLSPNIDSNDLATKGKHREGIEYKEYLTAVFPIPLFFKRAGILCNPH